MKHSLQRGFTLIELMLASAVTAAALLGAGWVGGLLGR
jgi:prepilin-type N-terminal cleavage/methylation domain-containing protein